MMKLVLVMEIALLISSGKIKFRSIRNSFVEDK